MAHAAVFNQHDGGRCPHLPWLRPRAVRVVERVELPALGFQVAAHFCVAARLQGHAQHGDALAGQFVYCRRAVPANAAPRTPKIQHGGAVAAGVGQGGAPALEGVQRLFGKLRRHNGRAPPVEQQADGEEEGGAEGGLAQEAGNVVSG